MITEYIRPAGEAIGDLPGIDLWLGAMGMSGLMLRGIVSVKHGERKQRWTRHSPYDTHLDYPVLSASALTLVGSG